MSYESLASVYDVFMDNVDYDLWSRCILDILKREGIRDGILCELGCGTGSMTERLADAGYDMIGIDASAQMLAEAQEKELLRKYPELAGDGVPFRPENGKNAEGTSMDDAVSRPDILYLQQDMRAFELYGTVRGVVSVCDSLNYILNEEDLLQVFRLVNNYLDPGGIFLFDVNTPACYGSIRERTIAENRPEGSFIWENTYDRETGNNRYDLTLFLPEDGIGETDRYIRHEETHIQHAWTEEAVRRLLRESGMICRSVTEAYTGKPVTERTERIFVTAEESGKRPV